MQLSRLSQENPVHPYLEKLHENPNSERTKEALKNPQLEKLYNKIYNNDEGGQYVRKEINKKGDTDTNSKKGIFNNRRGWNNRSYFQEELDNSSFSLKQKQLDIILKNNPVQDDYHTWIRTVDDIKTLEETIADSDWADYDEFNPDLTKQDIEDAINSGKIMVYSSYPIGQGIFVSPSRMEAESYSSDGKVYSKEVNIDDVAWIDPTQGQYAKVQEKIAKNN